MPEGLPFDEGKRQIFLCSLALYGQLQGACDAAGIAYQTYLTNYKKDKDFADRTDAAKRLFLERIHTAAFRRFTEGVEKPIIGGKDRNEIVTTVKEFSDSFYNTLLKKYDPEVNAGGSGWQAGNPNKPGGGKSGVLVMPPELTLEEFAQLFDAEIAEHDAI